MFNNLSQTDIKVDNTSDDDLLEGFDIEDKTKGKTKGKSKDADDDTDDDDTDTVKKKTKSASSKSKKDTSAPKSKTAVSALSKDDFESTFGDDDDDDDTDEEDETDDEPTEEEIAADKKKKKKEKEAAAKKKAEQAAAKDDDDDEDDDNTDADDDTEEEDEEDEDDDNASGLTVQNFLKQRVNLLISKGEWVDFENSKDVEWDEDNFADMEMQQSAYKKELIAEEIMDSFGPIGRDIATYTKNGGNPDDLLDIFKEQKRVENLAIDTEDQQRAVVMKFATEYSKMKPERAKKYIDGLIADKELASVASENKEEMESELAEQAETLKKQNKKDAADREAKVQSDIKLFANKVHTALTARTDLTADEKKNIARQLTVHNKKLPNGNLVNEFYSKLNDFRKDITNYIELVRFVDDPKKYKQVEKLKGKTETAEKAFSLLRSDNKRKSAKSQDINTATGNAGKSKKQSGFKLL